MSLKSLESLDIVLSVYNQENLITKVLAGIDRNTTTLFNLIVVFDGCTDRTEQVVLEYIKAHRPSLMKDFRSTKAPNVYETKANNIGFRMGSEPYLITLQDDMIIEEKGWERRLTYPLRAFNDIFAVTARTALTTHIDPNNYSLQYTDKAAHESFTLRRNTFTIRNSINRGPIAFRTDILRKLNYLDEAFAPAWLDEADMVLRAYEQFDMKSGAFWIGYQSDISWGKTRSKESSMDVPNTLVNNAQLLLKKHPQLSKPDGRIIESRTISDRKIDYIVRDNLFTRLERNIIMNFYFIRQLTSRKINGLRVRLCYLTSKSS